MVCFTTKRGLRCTKYTIFNACETTENSIYCTFFTAENFANVFLKSLLAASVSSHFGKATHHHFVFNEPEVFDKPVEMFRNNAAMQQANYWDWRYNCATIFD